MGLLEKEDHPALSCVNEHLKLAETDTMWRLQAPVRQVKCLAIPPEKCEILWGDTTPFQSVDNNMYDRTRYFDPSLPRSRRPGSCAPLLIFYRRSSPISKLNPFLLAATPSGGRAKSALISPRKRALRTSPVGHKRQAPYGWRSPLTRQALHSWSHGCSISLTATPRHRCFPSLWRCRRKPDDSDCMLSDVEEALIMPTFRSPFLQCQPGCAWQPRISQQRN